ncbi:MAG: hypothetical protein ACO35Q_06715 [Prochlorothrix sp.]
MQTRTDLPQTDLHDRLNQGLAALSPPLLQMVLDFVEFLLGQQQRLEAGFEQEDETAYLLKSKANAEHLARSIAEYRQGQVVVHDLVYNPVEESVE